MFQFLIGRLGTSTKDASSLIEYLCFNSLQVGQVLPHRSYIQCNWLVSIPYRQARYNNPRMEHHPLHDSFNSLQVGQVRIMGHKSRKILRHVSIPYRQARYSNSSGLQPQQSAFQFLIGRLGTSPPPYLREGIKSFNSLQVGQVLILIRLPSGISTSFQFLIGRLGTSNRYRSDIPTFKVSIPYRQARYF